MRINTVRVVLLLIGLALLYFSVFYLASCGIPTKRPPNPWKASAHEINLTVSVRADDDEISCTNRGGGWVTVQRNDWFVDPIGCIEAKDIPNSK